MAADPRCPPREATRLPLSPAPERVGRRNRAALRHSSRRRRGAGHAGIRGKPQPRAPCRVKPRAPRPRPRPSAARGLKRTNPAHLQPARKVAPATKRVHLHPGARIPRPAGPASRPGPRARSRSASRRRRGCRTLRPGGIVFEARNTPLRGPPSFPRASNRRSGTTRSQREAGAPRKHLVDGRPVGRNTRGRRGAPPAALWGEKTGARNCGPPPLFSTPAFPENHERRRPQVLLHLQAEGDPLQ